MRDPALHITKSDFLIVLTKVLGSTKLHEMKGIEQIVDDVYAAAIPYHIKNRYIIKGDTKTIKQMARVIDHRNVASFSVERFNGLLNNLRQLKGARFIQKLNKGSKEWLLLGEILTTADSFVTTFQFEIPEEGYKAFINLGLDLMGRNYGLNKFKYYASKIHEKYEAVKVLEEDNYPEGTIKFWEAWKVAMSEHAGGSYDIVIPEKMIHMIYGRQEADEAKARYTDWIEAQFDQLAFMEHIPELSQFYGQNAKLRYDKYQLNKNKNKIQSNNKAEKESEEVYNLPSTMDEDQKEYFRALRAKRAGD